MICEMPSEAEITMQKVKIKVLEFQTRISFNQDTNTMHLPAYLFFLLPVPKPSQKIPEIHPI